MTDAPFLSGKLLLSMPGMADPRFERAAIAVCMHDEDGALGLVVNRTYEGLTARRLMRQLDIDPGVTPKSAPVHAGGPVEPVRGFVLHTPDYDVSGTIQVAGRWGLTASLDVLKDIAAGKGPAKWLLALGYTGWGEGQLDEELTRHGWLPAAGDDAIIFDVALEDRWPRAYAAMGIDISHLSPTAGRA